MPKGLAGEIDNEPTIILVVARMDPELDPGPDYKISNRAAMQEKNFTHKKLDFF